MININTTLNILTITSLNKGWQDYKYVPYKMACFFTTIKTNRYNPETLPWLFLEIKCSLSVPPYFKLTPTWVSFQEISWFFHFTLILKHKFTSIALSLTKAIQLKNFMISLLKIPPKHTTSSLLPISTIYFNFLIMQLYKS